VQQKIKIRNQAGIWSFFISLLARASSKAKCLVDMDFIAARYFHPDDGKGNP